MEKDIEFLENQLDKIRTELKGIDVITNLQEYGELVDVYDSHLRLLSRIMSDNKPSPFDIQNK